MLLNHVNIPRCYFPGGCSTNASFQLHHFSDASEFGYRTVSYLRKETEEESVKCSFIMAKSRTAPLQYVSAPRLELQAATIAVRVHSMILKEIDWNISSTFFWTDSKITLQYINNESRRFNSHVANRVSEIRGVSQASQWRHCPGTLNPADDASRGLSAHQLLSSERWFSGPAFLSKPEEDWPQAEVGRLPEDDLEVKNEKAIFNLTISDKLHELLVRYSSWAVLQRKVAWLLKFKAYLQCPFRTTAYDPCFTGVGCCWVPCFFHIVCFPPFGVIPPSLLFNRACNGALYKTCVVWLVAFHSKKRLYRVFTIELTSWRLFNRSNDD